MRLPAENPLPSWLICAEEEYGGAATAALYTAVVNLSALDTGTCNPFSEFLTPRAASGFSHNRAINAATRSQTIIAQKTFAQEPVLAKSQAAPGPAKAAAAPFAV